MKKIYLFLILLILILAVATAGFLFLKKEIKIQDMKISFDQKPLKVNITYPKIEGQDDFNQRVKTIIDKELKDFSDNSLANDQAVKEIDPEAYAKYPRQYELDISYDKGEVNNNFVSIVFDVYNFEGGAHGANYPIALNYNLQSKQEIKLADLFASQKDYLQKISDFCIKDLTNQLTKSGGIEMTDAGWIQRGAGPTDENFQFFLINPNNTITFYFPQYQVAAGAAGDFKVTMPR